MKKDKTAFPASQVKLQKYKKYPRRKGLRKALNGATGGGLPDKYCLAIRDADRFRPQPSLAPCDWLLRPDPCPELAPRVLLVDSGYRVVGAHGTDQEARRLREAAGA
jgi:hypothetical protein